MMTTESLPQKALLRPDEVASFFGVCRRTVYNWNQEGRIDTVKTPGGGLRIRRESVIAIVSCCTD